MVVVKVAGLGFDSEKASTVEEVKNIIEEAALVSRKHLASYYNEISLFSMNWEKDDTCGKQDSELILETMSKLPGVRPELCQLYAIQDEDTEIDIITEIGQLIKKMDKGSRRLLMIHYAGVSKSKSTSANLLLVPGYVDELNEGQPCIEFSAIKHTMMSASERDIDILMIMDCCCADAGVSGGDFKVGRVEFIAASNLADDANSRKNGKTFTQAWCRSFDDLFARAQPFSSKDILSGLQSKKEIDDELAQFPYCYILQEGKQLDIKFSPKESAIPTSPGPAKKLKTLLLEFQVKNISDIEELSRYLCDLNAPFTVLGAT